jgi:hypothetical protein
VEVRAKRCKKKILELPAIPLHLQPDYVIEEEPVRLVLLGGGLY